MSLIWVSSGMSGCYGALLLRNQGTSLVAQHMELALWILQSICMRRSWIHPAQQVNRPGAKVGLGSLRAAPCAPCLCRGGQRSVGWRHTLDGTCSARPTLDAMRALLPLPSGNSATSCSILTVGDLTVDFKRVSDFQRAAFMVPFGVFVGVKIIKLQQSHCQFVSLQ